MFVEPRKRFVKRIRDHLIGPAPEGSETLLGVLPTERFPCGALYPTSRWGDGIDPAGSDEIPDTEIAGVESEAITAEPAIIRRYIPPSSVGFSFFVSGGDIRLQLLCTASRYKYREHGAQGRFLKEWTREPLAATDGEILNISETGNSRTPVLGGRAHIDLLFRQYAQGWIVTVTLCNAQEMSDDPKQYAAERAEKTLFEAQLRCVIDRGEVGVYPRVDRGYLDEEQQEIEVRYMQRHIYAIGHGGAVDWKLNADGKVHELCSNSMPVVEVPQVTADTGANGDSTLSLQHLSSNAHNGTALSDLASFVNGYGSWVSAQQTSARDLAADDQAAGHRIVSRALPGPATARLSGHHRGRIRRCP